MPPFAGKIAGAATVAALLAAAIPGSSSGDLSNVTQLTKQYSAGQQQASALQSKIDSESNRIGDLQGSVSSLQGRLDVLQRTISIQQQQLGDVRQTLASNRIRLTSLRTAFARDQHVLAAQMVQRYETPPPSVVDVIVDANGWSNLLSGLSNLTAIAEKDAEATDHTATLQAQLTAQTKRLEAIDGRKLRQEAAVISERDQIANVRLTIVQRELAVSRQKNQDSAHLEHLRGQLSIEAHSLAKQAEAAAVDAYKSGGVSPVGCVNTPFVAHGGEYGFFQAPGTDYTVNEEPVIAARLDALGRALDLHLVGISGYRTPQHSVEVGGFADDPHTRGEASDTPGVEGVPEATLEEFCLTRPFPSPQEADHIQELGSPL